MRTLYAFMEGLKGLQLVKKRLQHRCFPVKFTKFLIPLFNVLIIAEIQLGLMDVIVLSTSLVQGVMY